MARKREPNKVHTSPERCGEDNFKGMELPKDEEGIMKKIYPMMLEGKKYKQAYKGLWTEDALNDAVDRFFDYCTETEFKPTIPALITWLGISRSQFYEWRANKAKYGDKSDIINQAVNIMELYLQANIDKYPTGSAFLLRTSHGHVETSKLDVQATTGQASTEDILDQINKLGLDGKKE